MECYNADKLSTSAELCNFDNTDDPLTPAERVECVNECYLPNRDHELWRDCGDKDEDEDTKDGDK